MKLTAITFIMVVALCATGIEAGTLALRGKELLKNRAAEKIGRTSTTDEMQTTTGWWGCGPQCKESACFTGCTAMLRELRLNYEEAAEAAAKKGTGPGLWEWMAMTMADGREGGCKKRCRVEHNPKGYGN